jgi:hypothetical protein
MEIVKHFTDNNLAHICPHYQPTSKIVILPTNNYLAIINLLSLPRSIINFASSIGSPSIDTPTLKLIGFAEKSSLADQ